MWNGSEFPRREDPPLSGPIASELAHYLYPGTLFADPRPHRVTTILGSCVAVCLWDPVCRIGGMNHFLLPLWNGEGLPTPRYGNVAIEALLDRLLALGCARSRLQAKLFGGAALWENPNGLFSIGERNIDLARRTLEGDRIPLVAADVGGDAGRKVIFCTGSGEVLLRRSRSGSAAGRPSAAGG